MKGIAVIEVKVNSEFGSYTKKLNHGHEVFEYSHRCIEAYKDAPQDECWENCPSCGLRPKVWIYDNGRQTACGCGKNIYDHFSVMAESIMSVHTRNNGNLTEYDCDKLRKNWNEYCATMINPCSHYDLRIQDRW